MKRVITVNYCEMVRKQKKQSSSPERSRT